MVNQSESCTTKTVSNNKRKRASKAQENQIGQESGPTNFNNQELQHPNNEQIADVTKSQNDKVKDQNFQNSDDNNNSKVDYMANWI